MRWRRRRTTALLEAPFVTAVIDDSEAVAAMSAIRPHLEIYAEPQPSVPVERVRIIYQEHGVFQSWRSHVQAVARAAIACGDSDSYVYNGLQATDGPRCARVALEPLLRLKDLYFRRSIRLRVTDANGVDVSAAVESDLGIEWSWFSPSSTWTFAVFDAMDICAAAGPVEFFDIYKRWRPEVVTEVLEWAVGDGEILTSTKPRSTGRDDDAGPIKNPAGTFHGSSLECYLRRIYGIEHAAELGEMVERVRAEGLDPMRHTPDKRVRSWLRDNPLYVRRLDAIWEGDDG